MIRTGVVGLGKMGISHAAIINTHPQVSLVAVCDSSRFVLAALGQHAHAQAYYTDYRKMIDEQRLDCVLVSTPTIAHAEVVRYAMERNIHVFVEKPLCLTLSEGREMVELARKSGLVNQVGYHNRFMGTFNEVKRVVGGGLIGDIYHFSAEAYGPVVVRSSDRTWRFKRSEGGGCLNDYASHAINLVTYLFGAPSEVSGTVLRKIFSRDVEDAVYSTMMYSDGKSGHLSVNWSDDTYRKMTTRLTLWGTRGKIYADRQECRVYLKDGDGCEAFKSGWSVQFTTDLTAPVEFYLRGEEYTAQLWYFVRCISERSQDNLNSFGSALETDEVTELLRKDAEGKGIR